MPQRNTIRKYAEKHYYHVYNRGVEKRKIFLDKYDYSTFINIIESYLTPAIPLTKGEILIHKDTYWRSKLDKDEVKVICYCLMPNHFHFIFKQNSKDGITKIMRRISNAYVKYFNKKYDRVGSLYQGKFKAVPIEKDSYLLYLSKYIHLNPLELEVGPLQNLDEYRYSSYPEYVGRRKSKWIKPGIILKQFSSKLYTLKRTNAYKNYVENDKNHFDFDISKYALDNH